MQSGNELVGNPLIPRWWAESKIKISQITQYSNVWNLSSYLLFVLYFSLIIISFQNYGITYDEFWRSSYGNMIIRWYQTGFQYKEALTYWNFPYYGGFSDVVQQLATKISPWGVFETRHLINALFGLLATTGVYKLGRLLATPFVGFLSVLFLLINPRFYGHSFNNPLDIPTATLYIYCLYFIAVLLITYPKLSIKTLVQLGATLGLALGVRISSVLVIGYIAFGFMCLIYAQGFLKSRSDFNLQNLFKHARRLFVWFGLICSLAYPVMLIWWPAAQVDPLRQPIRSLKYFTRFEYTFNVFFDGRLILNTELPWFYQIKWFLITMPEFVILALAIGLILLFILNTDLRKFRLNFTDSRQLGIVLLLISVLVPMGYTIVRKPTDYDGIRHFLFVVPPLCVLGAISIGAFLQKSFPKILKFGTMALIVVSLIVTVTDMVRLHPNQYIYFNRLFGQGVAEASLKYDTDYWGNSYKEAAEWVVKNYPVPAGSPKLKVASCLFSLSTSYYLQDDRFEYIGSYHDGQKVTKEPDIFLSTTRWNCDEANKGEVIHEITRMGASLVQIKKVIP